MQDRNTREKADSGSAYCDSLLNSCEFIIRHLSALLCASLPHSEAGESIRYRTEYELFRTSGIGDWSRHAQQLLAGPNFSLLTKEIPEGGLQGSLSIFTRPVKGHEDQWIVEVVIAFRNCLRIIGEEPNTSKSIKLIEFINEFPRLRNKMDAHGAPTSNEKSRIADELEVIVENLIVHVSILQLAIVRVDFSKQSGIRDSRVLDVVGNESPVVRESLKNGFLPKSQESGLFVVLPSGIRRINLLYSETDLLDFFYANGNYKEQHQTAEFLSYVTNGRKRIKCTEWSSVPLGVSESVTAGTRNLRFIGTVLTNLPQVDMSPYVRRPKLEKELIEELSAPYRRVITLKGIGGVGKTTLALSVVNELCEAEKFDVVIWASARDLDLVEDTSRQVKPSIQSTQDLANLNKSLISQIGNIEPDDALAWFGRFLGSDEYGRILWVLDNFETLQDTGEVFSLIDRALGPTNRVLITTRHRDFYGDYQIEVRGLERKEFTQLAEEFGKRIGISLPNDRVDQIFRDTDGHPYIAKMMISELRNSPMAGTKSVISKPDLQDNLLERTYSRLSEGAAAIFLLLSTFNSAITGTAIRLAIYDDQTIEGDIESLIDELASNSLVEVDLIEGDVLVHLPSVAMAFGSRKLVTSDLRTPILAMSGVLKLFGPINREQISQFRTSPPKGSDPISRFWKSIRRQLNDENERDRYLDLAREVARTHSIVWRWIAEYFDEENEPAKAISSWKMFIEAGNLTQYAWWQIAQNFEKLDRHEEALAAWVSRAKCEDATIQDVSFAANKLNGWVSRKQVKLDSAEKVILIDPLVSVLESRINECSADDLSRLAHLYTRLENHRRAREVAEMGLVKDPQNQYCLRFLGMN